MSLSENRKYLSRQEMERLAYQVLPDKIEFTTKEFKDHCERLGIPDSTGGTLLHKMKNSKMIDDVGKADDSLHGRVYVIRDYWQKN